MKISASVYSGKDKKLEDLVTELDRYKVDFLHIDCNDNPAVFQDIEKIRKISQTPIDLHIISKEPEKYFSLIESSKTEQVCFQFENLPTHLKIPKSLRNTSRIGLALVSETPSEVFEDYRLDMDFVLMMATSPGKSGGTFNISNFEKIRRFKNLFPETRVHVDGGVNDEISFVLRNMGVSLVVSGNYLVNSDYIGAALHNLKTDNISSHILVEDFMIGLKDSPTLPGDNFNFFKILNSIEIYNMGFTMIVRPDGVLEGIVTNADVRRGLLKHTSNLNLIDPKEIINRNPVTIRKDQTVSELLKKVKSLSFPVLFLPVVDSSQKLCGTITFNNLIKGES